MSKRSFKDNINELYQANVEILQSKNSSEFSKNLAMGACFEFLKLMYRMSMIDTIKFLKEWDDVSSYGIWK